MKIALIFAVAAVAANLFFIWCAKRKGHKTKAEESSNLKDGSNAFSYGYLNTPEVKKLRQSAAAELSVSIEELNRMSVDKITQLANEKQLVKS
jgi:hypothetical protein